MQNIEYISPGFFNTTKQAEQVGVWRKKYQELLDELGKLGTQVRMVRTLERDQDIAPYRFVRGAHHEFIFPPQDVAIVEDASDTIDPSSEYRLHRENVTYGYDAALVAGKLAINYDDANSRIVFTVQDVGTSSVFPEGVTTALSHVA